MDNNTILKSLAEGYFALTGRPISTMTVEEYKVFYNMANNNATVANTIPTVPCDTNVETSNNYATNSPVSNNQNNISNLEKENKSITKTKVVSMPVEQNDSSGINSNNLLIRLKSISG